MAYLPGYKHDLFISYAHVDNGIYPGEADGWMDRFHATLRYKLAERFGRMDTLNIWWDNNKLRGNSLFDVEIAQAVKDSAIFICIYSYAYAESEYCKNELNTFWQKTQTDTVGLNVNGSSRIIQLLLYNIPHSHWPAQLAGTSGYPFYEVDQNTGTTSPFETDSDVFSKSIRSVAETVWQLMNDMKAVAEKPLVQSIAIKNTEAFTIYLGEVADTLRTPRKRIITELEKKGFNVLVGIPPPDDREAHEKATNDALNKSDLAVNLLDLYPGREIEGLADTWYPQRQAELALSQSDKPQMIWIPAETDVASVEEENYKQFLSGLETRRVVSKNYDFIRGNKSTLAQDIIDFAETLKAQKQIQAKKPTAKLAVLLDVHAKDECYALDLSKGLFENGIWTVLNPQEDNPRKNLEILSERMSRVSKLVFIYGSVEKDWVQERISAALQLIITNNYPIEDFFVYMAPPQKQGDEITIRQKFIRINIINSSHTSCSDQGTLQHFLDTIKNTAA